MKLSIKILGLTMLALFCLPPTIFSKGGESAFFSPWRSARAEGSELQSEFVDLKHFVGNEILNRVHGGYFNQDFILLNNNKGQKVDTTKLVKLEKHYGTNSKETYWFAEVDSNHIGILNEELEWVVEPKYCAIAAYNTFRGLVSARACPYDFTVQNMEYWDDLPIYGNWGVADTEGNWIIDPVYYTPISLYQKSQLVYNGQKAIDVPIVNLEEKWMGTYNHIADFGHAAYLFKENGKVGLRKLPDEWIIQPKKYKFYANSEEFVMLDSSAIALGASLNLIRVNKQYEIEKINGFNASFDLLSSMTRFVYMASEDVNLINENVANAHYLQQDSVLTKWFLIENWDELFGSTYDNFKKRNYSDDSIDYAFADTIYTSPQNHFYPYIRIDEYDNSFKIGLSEKSTYSIYKNTYHVNFGSRGPAYEDFAYEIKNIQIIDARAVELNIGNCFKRGDVKPIVSYLGKNFKDSFNFSEEYILGDEYLWKLVNDSLVLFFPKTSQGIPYSEFQYNYSRLAISTKEFGRKYLNERRRRRVLKAD